MNKIKIVIELTKSEIKKLEDLTDIKLLDDDFISDDEISDAISILIANEW